MSEPPRLEPVTLNNGTVPQDSVPIHLGDIHLKATATIPSPPPK